MVDPFEVVMVLLVAVWALGMLVYLSRMRRRTRLAATRYRIFAVRDRLVRLVIDGHLSTDHPVYQETCEYMNILLRVTPEFTPSSLARAVLEQSSEEDDPQLTHYVKALREAEPEVLEVIEDFWHVLGMTLADNSRPLRVYVWLQSRAEGVASLLARLGRRAGTLPTWEAYKLSEKRAEVVQNTRKIAHA